MNQPTAARSWGFHEGKFMGFEVSDSLLSPAALWPFVCYDYDANLLFGVGFVVDRSEPCWEN